MKNYLTNWVVLIIINMRLKFLVYFKKKKKNWSENNNVKKH